jgi:NAD(P)H-hydrate repair Nnr-like enzyme with NAD(P)H-hydrate dehydratase domain
MARGLSPMDAAELGVRWHLECGKLAGPGLIAEDLPEVLPRVLRKALSRNR